MPTILEYLQRFDFTQRSMAVKATKGQKDKHYTLQYCTSTNPRLPAAIGMYEALGAKTPIWTNLPDDHWILQNQHGGAAGGLKSLSQAAKYAEKNTEWTYEAAPV